MRMVVPVSKIPMYRIPRHIDAAWWSRKLSVRVWNRTTIQWINKILKIPWGTKSFWKCTFRRGNHLNWEANARNVFEQSWSCLPVWFITQILWLLFHKWSAAGGCSQQGWGDGAKESINKIRVIKHWQRTRAKNENWAAWFVVSRNVCVCIFPSFLESSERGVYICQNDPKHKAAKNNHFQGLTHEMFHRQKM